MAVIWKIPVQRVQQIFLGVNTFILKYQENPLICFDISVSAVSEKCQELSGPWGWIRVSPDSNFHLKSQILSLAERCQLLSSLTGTLCPSVSLNSCALSAGVLSAGSRVPWEGRQLSRRPSATRVLRCTEKCSVCTSRLVTWKGGNARSEHG